MAGSEVYTYHSPLGTIAIKCYGEAVAELRFGDGREAGVGGDMPPMVRRWIDIYFAGGQPGFVPPLCLNGTMFQKHVWDKLAKIPYGATVTYGDIARGIGCRSARAVGQAIGHNPVAVIVPCHRVVGSGGRLTGYAFGIERKKWLIEFEKQHV